MSESFNEIPGIGGAAAMGATAGCAGAASMSCALTLPSGPEP